MSRQPIAYGQWFDDEKDVKETICYTDNSIMNVLRKILGLSPRRYIVAYILKSGKVIEWGDISSAGAEEARYAWYESSIQSVVEELSYHRSLGHKLGSDNNSRWKKLVDKYDESNHVE